MTSTKDAMIPWAYIRCINDMIKDTRLQNDQRQELPIQILPWLYLSDQANAHNREKLIDLKITHVLSVNGSTPYQSRWSKDFYDSLSIKHTRINGVDDEGYAMIEKHWDECFTSLKETHYDSDSSKIVVHCVAGINRSALIICAALMVFEQMNVLEAVDLCLKKRGTILSNKSFRKQLCIFAASIDKLGEKPDGYVNDAIVEEPLPPPPIRALDRLF